MADEYLIEPDRKFIKSMISMGGDSVKKCFQCATCSTMCSLSPDTKPFPRKEMIWAQWGLKDRLLRDPDVWLCHQCNDCSETCPRGANPSDLLGAVRKYIYMQNAFPKFLGKALSEAKYLPLLFGLPIILLLGILISIGNLEIPSGEIVFAKFFPHLYVDSVFIAVSVFVMLSFAVSISRFWKNINTTSSGRGSLFKSIIDTVIEILTHRKFKECDTNKSLYTAHLAIAYGFIGLFITTGLVFFGIYVLEYGFHLTILTPPLSLVNPVKIFANLSTRQAVAITYGNENKILFNKCSGTIDLEINSGVGECKSNLVHGNTGRAQTESLTTPRISDLEIKTATLNTDVDNTGGNIITSNHCFKITGQYNSGPEIPWSS